MKRVLALLCAVAVLCCACSPQTIRAGSKHLSAAQGTGADKHRYGRELKEDGDADNPGALNVYIPPEDLGVEETIEAYFEQQYRMYTDLAYIDISALLDTGEQSMRNLLLWLQILTQRRRLLYENDLCYVETERFDYTVEYLDEADLEDQRMEFWSQSNRIEEGDVVVHFEIGGEAGKAYPPLMAPNAQHTMLLKKDDDGEWRISFHYFPGSVRKFTRNSQLYLPSAESMLEELSEEFAPAEQPEPSAIPAGARSYDGLLAAEYARRYTERPNTGFYHIGDWMGNCANFISQCVWYGFSEGVMPDIDSGQYMTSAWYAGEGGGSPAWENVVYFWENITGGSSLRGRPLGGVGQLRPGDVVQTRSAGSDRFNHSLLVVDADTLLLAQNSPGCYVYYSDLVQVETRFVRPVSLLA